EPEGSEKLFVRLEEEGLEIERRLPAANVRADRASFLHRAMDAQSVAGRLRTEREEPDPAIPGPNPEQHLAQVAARGDLDELVQDVADGHGVCLEVVVDLHHQDVR